MSASPVYVGTPKTWTCALSAANTNRDGTGTLVDLVAGGSIGSRVDTVRIIAKAAIAATTVVRLFLFDGTNTRLFKEVLVPITTPSTTVETFTQDLTFGEGLVIPNGWKLQGSVHTADPFNLIARGGDF